MNINWYRQLYKDESVSLKDLMAEHRDDEQVIVLATWDRYLSKSKNVTLRAMLRQLGNIRCDYLGERSPYYRDEGYLDFVCWPETETDRRNKTKGIHVAIGVRSET
jgi:hypothetical protein